jgi:hypothetical protein
MDTAKTALEIAAGVYLFAWSVVVLALALGISDTGARLEGRLMVLDRLAGDIRDRLSDPPEPTPHTLRQVDVVSFANRMPAVGYVAVCTCNWESPSTYPREQAVTLHREHQAAESRRTDDAHG